MCVGALPDVRRVGVRRGCKAPFACIRVDPMLSAEGMPIKKAAGDVRPPPPHAHTGHAKRMLLRAAAGAAASLPIGLHAAGRALIDAAHARATVALAPAGLAAATAITRRTAGVSANDGGGNESQCRPENQTVHGKFLLHGNTESITPRHDVCTWESQGTRQPAHPASGPTDGTTRVGSRFSSATRHRESARGGLARHAAPRRLLG